MSVASEVQQFAYEVVDIEGTIWGVGDTAEEAWEDARLSYLATWNGDKDEITDNDMDGLTIKPNW
jgi:hypothetical protein